MSKLTTIGAGAIAALLALSAHAQPVTNPGAYCNAIAQYAGHAAEARDAGVPLIRVMTSLEGTPSGRARDDMVTALGIVFTEPHTDPASEATLVFEICWSTYGE